jgi:hypothetical protein
MGGQALAIPPEVRTILLLVCSPRFKKNPEASFIDAADLSKAYVIDEYKQELVQEYAQTKLKECLHHAQSYQEFGELVDKYFINID